jgi:hypothetical protein
MRRTKVATVLTVAASTVWIGQVPAHATTHVRVTSRTDVALGKDFRGVSGTKAAPLSMDYLNGSADMGQLIDSSQVRAERAPRVGFVVGTAKSLAALQSVQAKSYRTVDANQNVVAQREDVRTTVKSTSAVRNVPTFPIGPGSYAINFKNNDPCVQVHGSSDSDNWMMSCDTVGFLDGTSTGDGRHAYDVKDDDGSRYWDWWTYHSYGSVHPSNNGIIDWAVSDASMVSYTTGTTVIDGMSGTTDYAPNASSCDGALSMGPFSFDFGGTLCLTSGEDLVVPDAWGSMGLQTTGPLINYNTVGFDYRVAVRIKQGVAASWYTINKASFEQRDPFNTHHDGVNFLTYS